MFLRYVKSGDLFLLRFLNNSIKCKPLDLMMPLITYLGSVIFAIGFCLAAFIYPEPLVKSIGLKSSIALSVSTLISQLIKVNVNRIRPFIKIPNLNIKKIGIDDYSFPSGHTCAAFSIAVTVALSNSVLLPLCTGLASLVGVSRIYLGVHYPSDVLVGIIIGSACSWLTYLAI